MSSAGALRAPSSVADSPEVEAQRVLRGLLDRALPVAIALGAVAVFSSYLRSRATSWHQLFTIHALLVLLGLAVYLARKRLSFRMLAGLLIAIAMIDGAANMFAAGLRRQRAAQSWAARASSRVSHSASGLTVVLAISIGVWSAAGVLITRNPSADFTFIHTQLLSPWSWVSQIAAAALFVVVIVVASYGVQRRLHQSLLDTQTRSRELEQAVAARTSEIARRESLQRALDEREATFRLLADSMTDVLFMQDMNLNVVYASPSAARQFGYSVEEQKRSTLDRLMTPESFRRATEQFRHYVALAQTGDVEVP